MTARDCSEWRGLLAMSAIGRASAEEDRALDDHLERCDQCRTDADDVRFAANALEFLDPAQVEFSLSEPGSVDRSLGGAYDGDQVRREERAAAPGPGSPPVDVTDLQETRRRRRRMTVAGTVAAGVAAAGIALVAWGSGAAPPSKTVALSGAHGVTASISLVSESWGTRATFRESGQTPGQVLTVSMKTESGQWWVAGSYRTTVREGTTVVQLSCAVPSNQITDVWVTDQAGHTVLNGYVS